MITLYGIPNCETVKKARRFLEANGVEYAFHDFRKQGVDVRKLQGWVEAFGWEKVLNRAGMTWRRMDEAEKETVRDAAGAMRVMREKPSIIKRPVLEAAGKTLLGFREEEYRKLFVRAA